jgi:hypothetical protein
MAPRTAAPAVFETNAINLPPLATPRGSTPSTSQAAAAPALDRTRRVADAHTRARLLGNLDERRDETAAPWIVYRVHGGCAGGHAVLRQLMQRCRIEHDAGREPKIVAARKAFDAATGTSA